MQAHYFEIEYCILKFCPGPSFSLILCGHSDLLNLPLFTIIHVLPTILSIQDLKREYEFMKDETAEWKKSYVDLQEEKEKLYQEMLSAMQERERKK